MWYVQMLAVLAIICWYLWLLGILVEKDPNNDHIAFAQFLTWFLFGAVAAKIVLVAAKAYSPHQTYLNVEALNALLNDIAHHYGLTLEECDDHAWDQIKDRTGKTINGEFIKDA